MNRHEACVEGWVKATQFDRQDSVRLNWLAEHQADIGRRESDGGYMLAWLGEDGFRKFLEDRIPTIREAIDVAMKQS